MSNIDQTQEIGSITQDVHLPEPQYVSMSGSVESISQTPSPGETTQDLSPGAVNNTVAHGEAIDERSDDAMVNVTSAIDDIEMLGDASCHTQPYIG